MAETKVNDFLEKERLGKLMWKYTIPCVISMLVADVLTFIAVAVVLYQTQKSLKMPC